jgi:formylglycine-generating enzyme required for sulfatase activity
MGSDPAKDKSTHSNERSQHPVHLSEFYIAKYPVTNKQYDTFVRAADHSFPKHWENGKIPLDKKNHPVVWVSWNDALAFCKWLSRETGRNFRLPTEAEWEKAARGTDGRIYPWGNDPPTPELCNFDKRGYDTTPVDQYSPQGDSPYGCADMAGNVWEWTLSLWGKGLTIPDFGYPYNPDDGREDVSASERIYRIWRGGAMHTPYTQVRCASRSKFNPGFQDGYLGFRVALVLFE